MLFYRVSAVLNDEYVTNEKNRHAYSELTRQLAFRSVEFNSRSKTECCFVSSADDEITCGMLSYTDDAEKLAHDFIDALGVKVHDMRIDEITFAAMQSLLRFAQRSDFIEDDDEVLARFDLDRLNGRASRCIDYTEEMLCPFTDKKALYAAAKAHLSEQTLKTELDRIYSGKVLEKVYGHPVHYFIETDNEKTETAFTETLFQGLYDNKRLRSRRYCVVDFMYGEFSRSYYDSLYKSCIGCAIVVRFHIGRDGDESEYADARSEIISVLCETMRVYRNQVLTVFSLPRACERIRKTFCEQLGNIGMIDIKEDSADYVKSKEYLKMLCSQQHIRSDKQLFAKLDSEKLYLPDELRDIFDEWYNVKISTSVFPQYKDIPVCRKEAVKEVAQGCAYDDLHEMIGLTEAKSVIGKALSYYKMQRIYKDKGIPQDRCAMHMVFTGNPGTAKTTVARLFARIMKENGLLSRGHLVEVGRSDLVGKYVGWTAQIVKDKFKQATGGVLFIDEAYSLIDEKNLFGAEAINTIVQEMENRREDLVVIFAGYPNEMEKFLAQNPGLRSRIAFHVPFADYSTDELCGIARLIGKSKGITLTNGAIEKLKEAFDAAKNQPDFGNGRYVRNVIEQSKMNQAERILSIDPDDVTEAMLTTIEAEDISLPEVVERKEKRRIGFGA